MTYQRFLFDRLDDIDLRGFEIAAPLSQTSSTVIFPGQPMLNANGSIDLSISQVTAHFTAGVTTRMDVSYSLPIISSSLKARGGGSARLGQLSVTLPVQLISAASTGLGDGVARIKYRLLSTRGLGVALATDFRLPTGDELDYHGAGAYGIKPFVIVSLRKKNVSPHLNAGFQWNGKSLLASQYANTRRSLPGQISYAGGVRRRRRTEAHRFFRLSGPNCDQRATQFSANSVRLGRDLAADRAG